MKPVLKLIFASLFAAFSSVAKMSALDCEFRRIYTGDGLPNNQVNCIYRDRSGFVWLGTEMGLARYDGFRFQNFFSGTSDGSQLPSSQIRSIMEDGDGMMWVKTSEGYTIYNPATEKFYSNVELWMSQRGMKGRPSLVLFDNHKNAYIAVNGLGCWFYDRAKRSAFLFRQGRGDGRIPRGLVTDITRRGTTAVLTFENGTLARIDGSNRRVVWVNSYLSRLRPGAFKDHHTFIDSFSNYWIVTEGSTAVYSSKVRRWFTDAEQFISFLGIKGCPAGMIVKCVAQDTNGRLWIATEHRGILVVDVKRRKATRIVSIPGNPNSLPDNTIQTIMPGHGGEVWVGTYKNGAAYYSPQLSLYATIPVGDICTIAQDRQGRYWCGTNDHGILWYDPSTRRSLLIDRLKTGLGSNIVVSSLVASDGSLWFGTFNGGMARLKDGRTTVWRQRPGGLASDNVWSLAEDSQGRIVIGTLGGGVQVLDPRTGRFDTFNSSSGRLASDYISSVFPGRDGNIYVGHSRGISIINPRKRQINNIAGDKDGQTFQSRSSNQVIMDSRGLVWNATMSGVSVYDPRTKTVLKPMSGMTVACAVAEDRHGDIWIALSHGVSRVRLSRKGDLWDFFVTYYDELDGLQSCQFNYRSILCDRHGNIVVGGQDGINVITPETANYLQHAPKALFSGIVLFDHQVKAGEKFNGRVVVDKAVNSSRELRLRHSENAFTVLLASDHVQVPQKARFMYCLEGFGDGRWQMTAQGQPSVTYTNLSPGSYRLRVKAVNRDGTVSPAEADMAVVVAPPFWLSPWAWAFYVLAVVAAVWQSRLFAIRRYRAKLRIQSIRQEAEHRHRMDEMKLTFLTSISHELRTPLSLIIAPLKDLEGRESDPQKRSRLNLILRNANRLLNLVNQTLDLRKIEKGKAELRLVTGDIVGFVHAICDQFAGLSQKGISFSFTASEPELRMSFDDDKVEKIVANLISNAYKYTPQGGSVAVDVSPADPQGISGSVAITVADTGQGVSDDDKPHIFDRFYQGRNLQRSPFGGSGIGLDLVHEFVVMHGGSVSVADNPGGGTVFRVVLPRRLDESLPQLKPSVDAESLGALLQDDPQAIGKDEAKDMEQRLKQGRYEVLVVDDSDDFLQFMSEMLSDTYSVSTARNGREALDAISRHRPDIILSDVMMPEMDGNELCRAVKSNPKTERIPFVMLTARLSTEHKIEGMASGADDYITKPFNLDLLNLRIGNLIKWRNATPLGEKVKPKIKQQEVTSVDEKLVADATAFIEQHLGDAELSVEAMSDALAMSRVHLYKRLLSVTGNTPSEFIRIVRLRHAAALLAQGQMNVSEAAYKVGFNNPRYFSKYFKDLYGVMPSQYKKQGQPHAQAEE